MPGKVLTERQSEERRDDALFEKYGLEVWSKTNARKHMPKARDIRGSSVQDLPVMGSDQQQPPLDTEDAIPIPRTVE